MFSSRQSDTDQRFEELKAEIQQVRRQIEAVGRQVADAPVVGPASAAVSASPPSDIAERCTRLEQRLDEVHHDLSSLETRLLDRLESRLAEMSPPPETLDDRAAQSGAGVTSRGLEPAGAEDEFDLGLSFSAASATPVLRPSWLREEPEVASSPSLPRPALEPGPDEATALPLQLERLVTQMRMDAPPGLKDMLKSCAAAISDLATSYRNASELDQHGELELVLRLRVDRDGGDLSARLDEAYQTEKARLLPLVAESEAAQQQRLDTVVRRDIPALIDICESSRRQFDPNSPFFMRLDARIQTLLQVCALESIEPAHGQPYDPSAHIALDLVESHDPSLKDHVESCRYRGYQLHGELLKKAGVVIYR